VLFGLSVLAAVGVGGLLAAAASADHASLCRTTMLDGEQNNSGRSEQVFLGTNADGPTQGSHTT
jgi:hypothetical protein